MKAAGWTEGVQGHWGAYSDSGGAHSDTGGVQ